MDGWIFKLKCLTSSSLTLFVETTLHLCNYTCSLWIYWLHHWTYFFCGGGYTEVNSAPPLKKWKLESNGNSTEMSWCGQASFNLSNMTRFAVSLIDIQFTVFSHNNGNNIKHQLLLSQINWIHWFLYFIYFSKSSTLLDVNNISWPLCFCVFLPQMVDQ